MNFLSHFYFDRLNPDPEQVMGVVLPDLIKNARKDWNIHPEKKAEQFQSIPLNRILIGWKRHLLVDKYFHSSPFFIEHTGKIRTAILPVIEDSPARPSFVAHIALELMLDSLLLTEDILNAADFYQLLSKSNRQSLKKFLELNDISESLIFFNFLDEFIEAAYLHNYRESHHIMFALNRICMRIWHTPFSETQKLQLTAVLINYQERLKTVFLQIFDQIENQLIIS